MGAGEVGDCNPTLISPTVLYSTVVLMSCVSPPVVALTIVRLSVCGGWFFQALKDAACTGGGDEQLLSAHFKWHTHYGNTFTS